VLSHAVAGLRTDYAGAMSASMILPLVAGGVGLLAVLFLHGGKTVTTK